MHAGPVIFVRVPPWVQKEDVSLLDATKYSTIENYSKAHAVLASEVSR